MSAILEQLNQASRLRESGGLGHDEYNALLKLLFAENRDQRLQRCDTYNRDGTDPLSTPTTKTAINNSELGQAPALAEKPPSISMGSPESREDGDKDPTLSIEFVAPVTPFVLVNGQEVPNTEFKIKDDGTAELQIEVGGENHSLRELAGKGAAYLMTEYYGDKKSGRKVLVRWVNGILRNDANSLLIILRGKMVLLSHLLLITARPGPAATEALKDGISRVNFVKFVELSVAWSILRAGEVADAKGLLLKHCKAAGAVEIKHLWVDSVCEVRGEKRAWEGSKSTLIKAARKKYIQSVVDKDWRCTKENQIHAATYVWGIIQSRVGKKVGMDAASLAVYNEGEASFKKIYPAKFRIWMGQSGPSGGIQVKNEALEAQRGAVVPS